MAERVYFEKGLKKIRESEVYDYILIDAPPTLGGWVMNILCASDYVILPVDKISMGIVWSWKYV